MQNLAAVSRYGDDEYGGRADVPLLFSGGGHYDLLHGRFLVLAKKTTEAS